MKILITHVIDVPDDLNYSKKQFHIDPRAQVKLDHFTHCLISAFSDGRTKIFCPKCGNRQSSCALSCVLCGTPMGRLAAKLVELKVVAT